MIIRRSKSTTRKTLAGFSGGLALLLASPAGIGADVAQQTGIDPQAELPYWQISNPMMSLRLVQRLPMQTRAFFLARGFDKQQVESIAQSCVFQTVFKNTSQATDRPALLEYSLRDWQVIHQGRAQPMKLREDWAEEWQAQQVSKPVQLAFEWALYPTRQTYQPGDYNWGMSIFDLPPGSRFDLKVVWQQGGETHRATLENMRCAEDGDVQSGENTP